MDAINREPTGFIFGQDTKSIKKSVVSRISSMTGIPLEKIFKNDILSLISFFDENHIEHVPPYYIIQLFQKYFGINLLDQSWFKDQRKIRQIIEMRQRLCQYKEVISDSKTIYLSYGSAAISYFENLQRIQENLNGQSVRSLLVGALTMDTVIEYQSLSRAVFSDIETFIIDIESDETRVADNFTFGNALSFPYRDKSLDIIQTNYLLHGLVLHQSDISSFFTEVYRVLKPGGSLLMVEGNLHKFIPKIHRYLVPGYLRKKLKLVGFQPDDIDIDPAKIFKTRVDMYRFF